MRNLAALEDELAAAVLSKALPTALEGTRAAVYRTLVRANLRDVLLGFLPRTIARRGDAFAGDVDRFLEERGPRTHYLRDVPFELVEFSVNHWKNDAPAYLADLARHELVAMEVAAADEDASDDIGALGLDDVAVLSGSTRFRRYDHAVHELSEDERDRTEPAARKVALLAYRDSEHQVRYLELSIAAAAIVDELIAGATLRVAIANGAAAAGVPVDDVLLQGIGAVLADLAARDVLLGGRAQGKASVPSKT